MCYCVADYGILIKNSNKSFSVDSKLSSNSKSQEQILSNPQCSMKCYICGKLEPQFSVKLQHNIPDGKHIRGRTSAVQHLVSLGGHHSEIAKLKNFSWFRVRKNSQSLDNTLEELVSEESDISLSSSFDSNASDMSGLFEDEKSSEVEQCQEYSGQDILDKIKHLQKLVKQGEQAEAQQTLLEIENSVTLKNKRTKR